MTPAHTAVSIWTIFGFSFMVALTGALAPGPLLTYTIAKTADCPRNGHWIGVWVIAGHALIESAIVLGLLAGLSALLTRTPVIQGIGVVGGILLVLLGASIVQNSLKRPMAMRLSPETDPEKTPPSPWTGHPILGGALVSMANPYWWIWWTTIGLAFMARFQIRLDRWPQLAAFFVGHEAGDLAWYLTVSMMVHFGRRRIPPKLFAGILVGCGLFMVGFGVYLGLSPFLQEPVIATQTG